MFVSKMQVNCFLCRKSFISCKELFCHLRYLHHVTNDSYFLCGHPICKQKFNCFKSFCRHMANEADKYLENIQNIPVGTQISQQLSYVDSSTSQFNNDLSDDSDSDENNVDINSIQKDSKKLTQNALSFTLKYYSHKAFPRSQGSSIQKNIKHYITQHLGCEINKIIPNLNTSSTDEIANRLKEIVSFCENPFQDIDSEYKFIKMLTKLDLYKIPQIINIDSSISNVVFKNAHSLVSVDSKGILFPIKFQIKKFFEIDSVFEAIIENTKRLLQKDVLANFCNGSLWKKKITNFGNKIVIPYLLYFDDFEINNPLGSHSSSILGVYYSFPTSPEFLKFKLNNIFIGALFNSVDVKNFGNSKCFFKLIEILNDLQENGVNIETKSGRKKLYFSLVLVVGDNLALNSILGFSRSFSANLFCRFCKMSKSTTHTMPVEDYKYLRNVSNYNHDVHLLNMEFSGIRENSIFNKISNFHVVENFYADILHDMLEGVIQYDMCHIIKLLIRENFIDLAILNLRKDLFDYGEAEIGNKSPPILERNLKQMNLKMSGRETLTFIHFFPLMVGDLIDSSSNIWLFLVNLVELVDIVLLPEFSSLDLRNLQSKIEYHNRTYITLFSDTLKPKHHFLTHYCRIVEHSGPLKYLWTFNFESKHRELKFYTKNIMSRKNILVSLAIKFGIVFSNFIANVKFEEVELGQSKFNVSSSKYFNVISKKHSSDEMKILTLLNNFKLCGTIYKKEFIIFHYGPTFRPFIIKEIYTIHKRIFLLCQELTVLKYERHYLSYIVEHNPSLDLISLTIDSVQSPPILIRNINGKLYLRPKPLFHKHS
ncbi:uncharacterized protein LOC142240420 [Haematobia irritans]|uniref:uncharacterized protein LOC142240420 n=1 Tax=Haematobia irritans TaxID=7368 RepID=UPI003F503A09